MIAQGWLRLVPGCEAGQAPRSASRLGSGTAHELWRVQTAVGDFVVRAPDPALPKMLTTAFDRELLLQRSAVAVGLAPRVFATSAAQQLMVMEHVDGRHFSEQELLAEPPLRQLLDALARLHAEAEPPDLPSLDPLANAVQFAQQLFAAQPADRRQIQDRLDKAALLWRSCLAERRAPAVIHCDLHVGNIIARRAGAAGSPLVLLDWEYAAVGDPLLDYGALLAQYPAASRPVEQHIASLGPQQRIAPPRLAAGTAVFALLSWLWWRARAVQQPDDEAANRQMAELGQRLDASLEQALAQRTE